MSLYSSWLNLIKEKADVTWLSHSQAPVYQCILSQWRSAGFVNLYGPRGAGKTFIARLLAKKHGYVYAKNLEELTERADQVVVDDAQYSRMMRPRARELDLGRVLLITERPVSDAMPSAELVLDILDVQQILHILYDRCMIEFIKTSPEGLDVSEILLGELYARGASHVS